MATKTKYVIKYKINGERRFEFAQLEKCCVEAAKKILDKIHDTKDDVTDIGVSKAL